MPEYTQLIVNAAVTRRLKAANHAGSGRYQVIECKLAPIADMACRSWIVPHERQGQDLNDVTHLKRWFEMIENREAVKRAYALADKVNPDRSGKRKRPKISFRPATTQESLKVSERKTRCRRAS